MPASTPAGRLFLLALVLAATAGALWWRSSSTPPLEAGAPQTRTVAVGDFWFCSMEFQGGVCETAIDVGDTVRWDFSGAMFTHSSTECGASCDTPTMTPLWDSGLISPASPSREFQHQFNQPGVFLYRCQVHPLLARGRIVVGGGGQPTPTPAPRAGDVNCSDETDAIDAALILQLGAGLVDDLSCSGNGDVNGDGRIDAIDAALVLQFVAGLLDSLPPAGAPSPIFY